MFVFFISPDCTCNRKINLILLAWFDLQWLILKQNLLNSDYFNIFCQYVTSTLVLWNVNASDSDLNYIKTYCSSDSRLVFQLNTSLTVQINKMPPPALIYLHLLRFDSQPDPKRCQWRFLSNFSVRSVNKTISRRNTDETGSGGPSVDEKRDLAWRPWIKAPPCSSDLSMVELWTTVRPLVVGLCA